MNIKEIKEMINLMNEHNLAEIEIEKDGNKIRLKKLSATSDEPRGQIIVEHQSIEESKAEAKAQKATSLTVEIKAPMVGTFYRAPSPEANPYVETGQIIEVGQVICIIEAMKLMNEIKSEIKAKIVDCLVENTEPVEFGQPIFLVEPVT